MRVMKWSIIALAVTAGTSQLAMASAQDDSKGFVEDSTLNLKLRALYMNRDYKHGYSNNNGAAGTSKGYREDTGLAAHLIFESGFTQGTVGVGVDALGFGSVRVDGGTGRQGNGLFASDSEGSPEHSQTKGGGAVKFRFSNTVLKVGDQIVASPVFSTDDGRLLPEVAQGTSVTINEIPDLTLNLGHFTSLSAQTGMYHDSLSLTEANIAGATYAFTKDFTGTIAASEVEDYFKKQYVNLNYTLPVTDDQSLNFDLNAYRTKDDGGQKLYGDIDNKVASLAVAYSLGAHKFTVAHQRNWGDTGYTYGVDGGGTVFLNNSVQISDFVGAEEKSWSARYDLNMASYGIPGLSFMTRYVYGYDIETGGAEGKEHEWDFETKYVIQEGPAKDLSFRLRNAVYRSNNAYVDSGQGSAYTDLNDTRFIVEYPLSIM